MNNESEQQEQEILDTLQGVNQISPEERAAQQEQRKTDLRTRWKRASEPQTPSPGDQELLRQCRSQDKMNAKQAFRQLMERYQNDIYTYLKTKVNEQQAFDITRDVFVAAYKHLEWFPSESSVKAWLIKIAKEQLLKLSRRSEKWYLLLLPMPLYQWYLNRTQRAESFEESPVAPKNVCDTVRNQLSAYIDNELASAETEEVENHLPICPACQEEFDRLLDTVDQIHSAKPLTGPANLWPAVNAALGQESFFDRLSAFSQKLTKIFPVPVAQLATVVLLVVAAVLGFFNYSQYGNIQDLSRKNAVLQAENRSLSDAVQGISRFRFIILTGSIASGEMPPEANAYVTELSSDPETPSTVRILPGTPESIGEKVMAYLDALSATEIHKESLTRNSLTAFKITATLPRDSASLISLFLQQLEETPGDPDETAGSTTLIEMYIIDKP